MILYKNSLLNINTVIILSLFIIFSGCAHFFQHNIGGSGLQLPFNVAVLTGMSILVMICAIKITSSNYITLSRSAIVYVFLTAVLLLPITYTNSHFLPLAKLKIMFVMVLPLFYIAFLQIEKTHFPTIFSFIIFSVLLEAIFGYIQIFILKQGNFIGFNVSTGIPYGIFQQKNVFATYLVMGIFLAIYILLSERYCTKFLKFLCQSTIILSIGILPLTQSKVALLSLVLGIIFILIAVKILKHGKTIHITMLLMIGGLTYTISHANLVNSSTSNAIEKPTSSASMNFSEQLDFLHIRLGPRSTIYPTTINAISNNLLKGSGFGSFDKIYLQQQAQFLNKHPNAFYETRLGHPHNEIMLWWVEGGIVSALAVTGMYLLILSILFRKGFASCLIKLAILMPLLLHSLVEYPFYHSYTHLFVFLLLISMFEGRTGTLKSVNKWLSLSILSTLLVAFVNYFTFINDVSEQMKAITNYKLSGSRNLDILLAAPRTDVYDEYLQLETMQHKIISAIDVKTGQVNKQLLMEFVKWGYLYTALRPNLRIYSDMIQVHIVLDEPIQAMRLWRHAIEIFPTDNTLRSYKARYRFQ